jgi:ribose transport system permease protein
MYAIAVGVAYQLLMGLIIVYVRVQPIIVALSGYLALSGINLVILPRPGGTAPDWMSAWGLGTTIDSPILVILVLCTAGWLVFTRTAFYGHLRLMGSDERAAYTSGVRITIVRLGAHCIAGIFSALAALTYTALIGSGDPTQGTTYTLISVTALVLGGTSLAGGRGGAIGSLLGAVNLFLIGYVLATFSFGAVQGFVTDLAYGVILVLSLLLTIAIPWLQRRIRHVSPALIFIVLSMLFVGVILHAKYDYSEPTKPTAAPTAPVAQSANTTSAGEATPNVETALPSTTAAKPPAHPARSVDLAFERWEDSGTDGSGTLARPIALLSLLVSSLLVIARAVVLQSQQRRWSPRMVIIVLVLLAFSAYLVATYVDTIQVPPIATKSIKAAS